MQAIGCLIIAYFQSKTVVLGALFLIMFGRSTVGGGQCMMPPELSRGKLIINSTSNPHQLATGAVNMMTNLLVQTTQAQFWRSQTH